MSKTIILGSGSCLPGFIQKNNDFLNHSFLDEHGVKINSRTAEIIEKFEKITGISERRYAPENQNCSDLASIAGELAIQDSRIDRKDLDLIIVAHNFGDINAGSFQTNVLPSIASKVKNQLNIQNERCIPYDIIFGCPGWIHGLIQADLYIQSGRAKKCLVIGAETLSRIVDPFDRDAMIFADGAGAVIVGENSVNDGAGIIAQATISHTEEELNFLEMGKSNKTTPLDNTRYIKMKGRKIYQYALSKVPVAMKECLDAANIDYKDVDKILLHQANEKMDQAIVERFYQLYGATEIPEGIMPMIIRQLGNSSVATIPTLYDLIARGELNSHSFKKNDLVLMASVGAGMAINCIVYRV